MPHNAESLFREVADLGEAERQQYYERQHVSAELRAEVESLLGFDGSLTGPLIDCVADVAERALAPGVRQGDDGRCGPYELERLLGRGGMGMVYLARRVDGEVEQQVAIKLVRNSGDEPVFRYRFLKERQILASLNHPGIARLLDAGHTAGGQPYLVLEYVDGTPIDRYCATLDVREKLEIFLKVSGALSYAHRHLVIHRDLKPSNILVEAGGQPKLLDFGIARILDEEGGGGVTRERLLTPDFASPEQVRGTAHTTATDVYSLGAVLYQMLTGRSPHSSDGSGVDAETIICSRDPSPPSHVNPALPRDLDFVLGKALRKEPEGRYATVEAFAEDIRALLDLRPVRARSGNAWYRMRRFLRRQWLPTAAAAVALIGLSAGLYTANRQRVVAQRRFLQLRQLANKVLEFDSEISGLPGSIKARQEIVSAGIEYLDGLGKEARGDRDLAMEVAGGFRRLGEVQGVPTLANLGQFANAEESLKKADQFVKSVLAETPGDPAALSLEAEIEQDQMILADSQNQPAHAREYGRLSAAHLDALTRGGHASAEQMNGPAAEYANVALSCMNRHELTDAVRYAERAVDLARSPGSPGEYLPVGLSLLANALRQSGDLEGALARIAEARKIAESAAFSNEVEKAFSLYSILWRQGQILGSDEGISLGRPDAALEPLEKAFHLMEQQASKDPNDATSRDREATAAWQWGDVLRHSDPARALEVYDRGVMREREIKNNVKARREEARLLARSSYPLRSLRRSREAAQRIDAAFELLRATKDYPSAKIELGQISETVIRALGDQQAASGHPDQAIATYRDLLDKVMPSSPDAGNDLGRANDLSRIYLSLARVSRTEGQSGEASRLDRLRQGLWREWDRRLPGNSFVLRQLAQ